MLARAAPASGEITAPPDAELSCSMKLVRSSGSLSSRACSKSYFKIVKREQERQTDIGTERQTDRKTGRLRHREKEKK